MKGQVPQSGLKEEGRNGSVGEDDAEEDDEDEDDEDDDDEDDDEGRAADSGGLSYSRR